MTTAESGAASALVDAIVAQDFACAVALPHPEIDFRAMTPNRVWEAEGRAGVAAVLREWFAARLRSGTRRADRLDALDVQRVDPAH